MSVFLLGCGVGIVIGLVLAFAIVSLTDVQRLTDRNDWWRR